MRLWNWFLAWSSGIFWEKVPRVIQHFISSGHAFFYEQSWSRILIKPYCNAQYGGHEHIFSQFVPASGGSKYRNFQEFFSRRLAAPRAIGSHVVWPCDGLLCEVGVFSDDLLVRVKQQMRQVRLIFGPHGSDIPNGWYFSNIFLHNRDYHRIHSPIDGTVTFIEKISGDLLLLRPWLYKDNPSFPALKNERVIVGIRDDLGRVWQLAIVGGPGVATITGYEHLRPGMPVKRAEELAYFMMGSTCCIASPEPVGSTPGTQIRMGDDYLTPKQS